MARTISPYHRHHRLPRRFHPTDEGDTRQKVLEAVRENGHYLGHCIGPLLPLRDDREIVLAAVQKTGVAVCLASDRLRGDTEIALAAVQQTGLAFAYLMLDESRSQNERILEAAMANGMIKYFSEIAQFHNDREMALLAIQDDLENLPYLSVELRDDFEIAMVAMQVESDFNFTGEGWDDVESPLSLLSDRLRDNREVVMAAVRQCGSQLESASERLRDDRDIVAEAIREDHGAIQYASDSLREDKEMALLTLPHGTLHVLSDRLRDDPETAHAFLEHDWHDLANTSERLQNDIAFVSSALCKQVKRIMEEEGAAVNTMKLFSLWNLVVGNEISRAVRTTSESVQERNLLPSTEHSFKSAARQWQTQYMEKVWLVGQIGQGLHSSNTSLDSVKMILGFAGYDLERTFLENSLRQAPVIDVASGSAYGLSWQEWLLMTSLPHDRLWEIYRGNIS